MLSSQEFYLYSFLMLNYFSIYYYVLCLKSYNYTKKFVNLFKTAFLLSLIQMKKCK